MTQEWKAVLRAVRVAGAASVGAVVGACSIGIASGGFVIGGAAAQTPPAPHSQPAPRLLPRDELVRRLRAGESVEQIERSPAAPPPRSAAMQFFCTHAYRVASFPEALGSIAAEAEIPLATLADDATGNAVTSAAAARARTFQGATIWTDTKARVRLFVVGDDCPSVYANPFAGTRPADWIVTTEVPNAVYDLEFTAARPSVSRMAFGFYYDGPSRQTRLAVFVSSRSRTLLVERLGILQGHFQYRLNLASRGWGRIDAASLQIVEGHTWLSDIQLLSVDAEPLRSLLLDDLRSSRTPYVELGGLCQVAAYTEGGDTACGVNPHPRVGTPCSCTFTHRQQSGTQEMISENVFGEVLDRWQEPTYRNVQTVRRGTVVNRINR